MNKKYISAVSAVIGVILLCISLVLTYSFARGKAIIGGADFPTLKYVFFYENHGICFTLALIGLTLILFAAILFIIRRSRKKR